MHKIGTHWTDIEIDELKKRHAAGESAQQIAVALGLMGSMGFVTRNMVLGRLWRLGLSKEGPTDPDKPKKPRRLRPRPRDQRITTSFNKVVRVARTRRRVSEQITGATGQWSKDTKRLAGPQLPKDQVYEVPGMKCVALDDLELTHCRWPLWASDRRAGDVGELRYCGAPTLRDCPYCLAHAVVAYVPTARLNEWRIPA